MYKAIRHLWIPAALTLSACSVQVNDTTPAEYPANTIGMYNITATVSEGALVTPNSLVIYGIGEDGKKYELRPQSGGTWQGLYPARCHGSFPLQMFAVWRLQGLSTRQLLEPPQPRLIKLTELPLSRQEGFDTAGKAGEVKAPKGSKGKGAWEGVVNYRFVTMPMTQITAARIEPSSGSAEDVAAARAISVKTQLPLQAPCADNVQLTLVSSEPRAHGTLDIETDNPGVPRWQTYVEFSPK